jgi:triacylglycerol lipase
MVLGHEGNVVVGEIRARRQRNCGVGKQAFQTPTPWFRSSANGMGTRMTNTLKRLTAGVLGATCLAACGGNGDGSSATPGGGSAFNLSNAVALMQLCLESYQMLTDFENGQAFSLPAPYTLQAQFYTQEHFTGDGTHGMVPIAFVATAGGSIYVVFRGTDTISEWISDATLTQVDYPYVANGGKTQTGFTDIYDSIRAPILQAVSSLAGGGTYSALYITGHSLGGALSVLAAPDLAAQTQLKQPVVYTFAGPRAGDPSFASLYDGDIATSWRVVNTNDAVPKLPTALTTVIGPAPDFKPELLFYEHVNSEYDVTFGEPIHSVGDVTFNHSACNYFATLCGQTSNPVQCKQMGEDINGCTFS